MTESSIVNDIVKKVSGCSLNDNGVRQANKLVKQFGLELVCEAVRIAFSTYSDGQMAWSKVGGICWCKTHRTCFNCKKFNGRSQSGVIDCPADGVNYSVKVAETCELFEERS